MKQEKADTTGAKLTLHEPLTLADPRWASKHHSWRWTGNLFIRFNPDHLTWKLLLWSSVSMFRITELRELVVLFSVRRGQRDIYMGKKHDVTFILCNDLKHIQNNSIGICEWIERNMKVSFYSFPILKCKRMNMNIIMSGWHKNDHPIKFSFAITSCQWQQCWSPVSDMGERRDPDEYHSLLSRQSSNFPPYLIPSTLIVFSLNPRPPHPPLTGWYKRAVDNCRDSQGSLIVCKESLLRMHKEEYCGR